jgi:3-dehydrosphinganine reductase
MDGQLLLPGVAVATAAEAALAAIVIIPTINNIPPKGANMKSSYNGKSVLIIGGSSGIGLAMAKQLAQAGANITIVARRSNLLSDAIQKMEAVRLNPEQKFSSLSIDITNEADVTQKLQEYQSNNGTPDYLFNTAGISIPALFLDTSSEVFRSQMDILFFGTVNVARAIIPGMVARRSGHVINFSSMAGFAGVYGYTAYGAAKFAVRGFSDTLRSEMREHNVRVSVVFPPDTDTPGFEQENKIKPVLTKVLSESNSKVMSADKVAQSVLNSVLKNKYIITPGFDTTFFYIANSITFNLSYVISDMLVNQARKKMNKS